MSLPHHGEANDSAASTAVGGLKLVREARVSMHKERLTISDKKVSVEYEFVNDTDADITTEVAFPIPEYQFEADDPGGARDFDDFRVSVEGKSVKYQVDIHAICAGIDRAELLRTAGIDISSFGNFDWTPMSSRDIAKLSLQQQNALLEAGLIDTENKFPQWTVRKTYHWEQTFPSKQILHVSHEYKPVIGAMPISVGDLDANERGKRLANAEVARLHDPKSLEGWYVQTARDIEQICVAPELQKRIEVEARVNNKGVDLSRAHAAYVELLWADYILTTANSWKTSIDDFELVVQRPQDNQRHWYVSFCWDGPIERPNRDSFAVHVKHYVPRHELRIGFLRP
jgi:hypothetical protein